LADRGSISVSYGVQLKVQYTYEVWCNVLPKTITLQKKLKMKTNSLYISSLKPHSGSLIVSMGMMEILRARFEKVAFFRPFIGKKEKLDSDIVFMLDHYNLDMKYEQAYSYSVDEVEELLSNEKIKQILSKVLEDFKALQEEFDFVLCEGLNRESFNMSISQDLNILVSKNLATPFISVVNAKDKDIKEIREELNIENEVLKQQGCRRFASFINRVSTNICPGIQSKFSSEENCFVLPEIEELDLVSVAEVLEKLECKRLFATKDDLHRTIKRSRIAAMTLENYLSRMQDGDFVIVPGDRADIIVGILASYYSKNHSTVSGIMLTGGVLPSKEVISLFEGMDEEFSIPVLSAEEDTFSVARSIDKVYAKIRPGSARKIALAIGAFNTHVDIQRLKESFLDYTSTIMTPLMFEFGLFERAREHRKKIVLPESLDERILRATEILLRRDVVDIILLGSPEEINFKALSLDLDISKARIVNPKDSDLLESFSQNFYEQRKVKGLSLIAARDAMAHSTYFATMMVQMGYADGMVSGAIHTTQDTIRPALQIIKTKPGITLVSSLFFMCMDTRVLVYADCAVNQDPSAQDLAQIAISSAATAAEFGLDVRIAMLSYSTGDSGQGVDVQKVKEATAFIKKAHPELLVEGPIQYDAAIDPLVAVQKLPNSKVAGQATIFIFPDLNTGNNTYKAVQRSSGAVAIGPVLQGLKKPVNDLSRGCLVADIVNTVAITAIQAGAQS